MRKISWALCVTFLTSCAPIRDEAKISGLYNLIYEDVELKLTILSNHKYSETAIAGNQSYDVSGSWKWQNDKICFDSLLIPKRLFPSFGDNSSHYKPKAIGPVYEVEYCLPGIQEYGKTLLELDPDGGHNFKRQE